MITNGGLTNWKVVYDGLGIEAGFGFFSYSEDIDLT